MNGRVATDRDLEQTKSSGIAVLQIDRTVWHINIFIDKGKLAGTVVHGQVLFSKDGPPVVELMIPIIGHPKVVTNNSGRIFFDHQTPHLPIATILKGAQDEIESWSEELERSLETELKGDKLMEMATSVRNTQRKSRDYVCKITGHTYDNPVPRRGSLIPPMEFGDKPYGKIKEFTPTAKQVAPPEPALKNETYVPPPAHANSIDNPTSEWNYAYANIGFAFGKVFYEAKVAKISPTATLWSQGADDGGGRICAVRIGWGTENRNSDGVEGVFYGNGVTHGHLNVQEPWKIHDHIGKFGDNFGEGDTITTAVDFDSGKVSFAKNGKLIGQTDIHESLKDKKLYPVVGLQSSCAVLNFCDPECSVKEFADFNTIDVHKQKSRGEYLWDKGQQPQWILLDAFPGAELEKISTSISTSNEIKMIKTEKTNVWARVFEFLDGDELRSCLLTCKEWHKIIGDYRILQKITYRCSVTGTTCIKDILAIGLRLDKNADGNIERVVSSLNAVSWDRREDFEENCDLFLPLVLDHEHGVRCHDRIVEAVSISTSAEDVVEGVTSLMDAVITKIGATGLGNMQEIDYRTLADEFQLYSHLHHILLFLASADAELQQYSLRRFGEFLKQPETRNPRRTPHLGKVLLCMSLLPMAWREARRVYITEGLDRAVNRVAREDPKLLNPRDPSQDGGAYMAMLFKAIKKDLIITMTQVYFLHVNRPPGLNISRTLERYNERLGFADDEQLHKLMEKLEKINSCDSFEQFFSHIHCKASSSVIYHLVQECFARGSHPPSLSATITPEKTIISPRRRTTPSKVVATSTPSLRPELQRNLRRWNIAPLWPLQQQILHHFAHSDVEVTAPMGTGKTTAACLSAISKVQKPSPRGRNSKVALITVPSKVACNHTYSLLRKLVENFPKPFTVHIHNISNMGLPKTGYGNHIVVGVPRSMDNLMSDRIINVENVVAVLLLEAMALLVDRNSEATMKFMETIPQGIAVGVFQTSKCASSQKLCELIIGDNTEKIEVLNNQLNHWYTYVRQETFKLQFLVAICQQFQFKRAIIYCSKHPQNRNIQERIQTVVKTLERHEQTVGYLMPGDNQRVLQQFVSGEMRLLVIGDQWSGLELASTNTNLVINYDLPSPPELYLRRAAVMGLSSERCHVLSFSTDNNMERMSIIADVTAVDFKELPKDCEL